MNDIYSQIALSSAFLLLQLVAMKLYFKVALDYNIVDRPNSRSSHHHETIRGGGVVFLLATISWFVYGGFRYPWMFIGVVCIGVISFLDDFQAKPAWLRFVIHLFGMMLLFYQLGLYEWPIWLWIMALVISLGALNAFNFMDGINGITGVYGLVSLVTFFYVNQFVTPFVDQSLIGALVISVLVFLFYNFRREAICFAGDVGSMVLGFVLIFLLLKLVMATNSYWWVLLFLVYGIDSVITIGYRLRYGENIFNPHRTHLYQYLTNEFKWSHLSVSIIYGSIQILINTIVVISFVASHSLILVLTAICAVTLYLVWRTRLVRRIKVSGVQGSLRDS